MWNDLQKNGGYYGLLMNFSNILYQYNAITKPYSERHMLVNIIYSVFTVISLSLYWVAYCKKKTQYITPAFLIVAFRNILRLFDFEESVQFMSLTEWTIICIMQTFSSQYFFNIFVSYFAMIKYHWLYCIVYLITCFISTCYGMTNFNNHFCEDCPKIKPHQLPGFY